MFIKRRDKNKIIGFDYYRWNCRIWRSKQRSWKNRRHEKAVEIIKQYEDIIKIKNKGNINVAYHQGQVFKRFKENEKFAKLVSELGIHKTIVIFSINIFKLCKKQAKLLKSSIGLGFFKNYHKNIKAICKEYKKDFWFWAFLSSKTKFVKQVFIRDMKVFICIHFHF